MDDYGGSEKFVWTKEHLNNVLFAGKSPVVRSPSLKKAMLTVDRADFLEDRYRPLAYSDEPVSIGHSQELTSPVTLAQKLDALDVHPGQKVLELGTGSGYTLAILSQIVGNTGRVFSVERNQQLVERARKNLGKYDILDNNFEIVFTDGGNGLIAKAPYDRIFAGFAFVDLPNKILTQLKLGGKMIVPMVTSEIYLFTRETEEDFKQELLLAGKLKKIQYGVE